MAGVSNSTTVNEMLSAAKWVTKNGKKYCYNTDGTVYSKTGLQKIDGKYYYFDKDHSVARSAWRTADGKRYFFRASGERYENPGLHKLTVNGAEKYYFFNNDFSAATSSWRTISGKKYFFRASGERYEETGLHKLTVNGAEKYYFFNNNYSAAVSAWKTVNGKRYFFRASGERYEETGLRTLTVNGVKSKYFFTAGHYAAVSCWKTVGSAKYYFGSNGKAVTGLKKIGTTWYYFKASGVMATGDVTVNNVTYYLNKKDQVEAYKKGSTYYKPSGTKMTSMERDDYVTLRRARAVVRKITTSSMTKSQKLKKCFDWVMAFPYKRHRYFPTTNLAWASLYANDHFVRKSGDCHADAAALAYLARALGYTDVYVCLDAKLSNPGHHAWTKINGLNYDPLFAQAKNYSKYYGNKSYELNAIVKERVGRGYLGDA